jgi:hypothetical protein
LVSQERWPGGKAAELRVVPGTEKSELTPIFPSMNRARTETGRGEEVGK